ncbi:MAG: calcium/sodium antiporter [Lachnospiraceae bacterium]|nr:calcium/sodium antiporter [Lachnospiraceae bacterium]
MIFNFVLLVAGFIFLINGADLFVDASSKIAMKFNVPQIVIGLTIVAFGTSAPEAAVSITAALKGNAGVSVGNILGSNIMNVWLILGLASLFSVLHIQKTTVKYEMPMVIGVSAVLAFLGFQGNLLSRVDGVILWILFIGFFIYLIQLSKTQDNEDEEELSEKDTMPRLLCLLVLGIVSIVVGSNMAVNGATGIAEALGISDRIIGLTIVAFGTSLPELVTSVIAARRGKADIAVGNIIGSNLFNMMFVLGTTALIQPIPFDPAFYLDAGVCILAVVLLFLLSVRKHELDRQAGFIMLACYIVYFKTLI